MATTDIKALTRRINDEVFIGGSLDLIDELVHDEFVDHEEFGGELPPGKERVRAFATLMREAFPDISATIEDLIAEGNKTVARVRFSGTHQGEFLGIPPTGKKIDVQTIDVFAWRDDKLTDHWGVTDMLAMMQQLGVIEEPE